MAKKKATTAPKKQPAKRKPGRQPRMKRIVGPAELQRIAELYIEGKSLREIGAVIGVDHATVYRHLRDNIRPQWREELKMTIEDDLAKTTRIEQEAWRRYREGGAEDKDPLKDAKWAIEHRAKLGGFYAPERHEVDLGGADRVAGKTPAEYARETLDLLIKRAESLREADLTARRNGT